MAHLLLSSHSAAPLRSRTAEFRQKVESLRPDDRNIKNQQSSTTSKNLISGPRGEFARRAGAIGQDIASTTTKLQRLAQLAKRKTLFDDRPVEISELTYIIKHDIASINKQLSDLQAFQRNQSKGKPNNNSKDREQEHRGNVLVMLQTSLAGTTNSFQEVLEVRTKNMKAQRDRTEQFAYSGNNQMGMGENSVLRSRRNDQPIPNPNSNSNSTDSPLYRSQPNFSDEYDPSGKNKGKGPGPSNLNPNPSNTYNGPNSIPSASTNSTGSGGNDFLALDMGNKGTASGGQGGGYMQMQMMENGGEDAYTQSRSTAIESIESTISELGSIFSQLANMVAEQRETVQRIDDNVMEVADNVGGAQRELLRYYATVSSNRWLMLKIFGTLIVFFLLFILVS